jgi:hypothetical protein
LLGQARAPVSVVRDAGSLAIASDFDSGYDFVRMFQLGGGMPTRVTIPEARFTEVMAKLAEAIARRSNAGAGEARAPAGEGAPRGGD